MTGWQASVLARASLFACIIASGVALAFNASDMATQEISDVGRDLVGLEAVQRGESPYRQLTVISPEFASGVDGLWVAHSPFALAVLMPVHGLSRSRQALELALVTVDIAAMTLLALWLAALTTKDSMEPSVRWAIPLLLLMSYPAIHNVQVGQLAGVTALAVVLCLVAIRRGRLLLGAVLLGFAVAWRPWLVVLVAAVPGVSESGGFWRSLRLRSVAIGVAIGATLGAVLALGGAHELGNWYEALTANMEAYRQSQGNLALTAPLSYAAAAACLGAGTIGLAVFSSRHWKGLPPWAGPLCAAGVIALLSPLMWYHYVVPLVAIVISWHRDLLTSRFLGGALVGALVASVVALPLAESAWTLAGALVAASHVLFVAWLGAVAVLAATHRLDRPRAAVLRVGLGPPSEHSALGSASPNTRSPSG